MPTMTISLDGVALKDIVLTQPRTTLGRRPYNDIVVDNLAVSGEHAVLVQQPQGLELIDLNSTNGTYVNGKAIVSTLLKPGDLIDIGRYQIRVTLDPVPDADPPPAPARTLASASTPAAPGSAAVPAPAPTARVRVLSGPAAGKEMTLTKVVTTLGKPGVAVAAINQSTAGYTFCRVDGSTAPLLNGQAVGQQAVPLQHKDLISIAGTEMCFLLEGAS
jgi:pSer/pThr/pTyr-binding forkhead associated (FHA) protein